MAVSFTTTCPNPALFGPPIRMTPIESPLSSMEIRKPYYSPYLTVLAASAMVGVSIGIAGSLVMAARQCYLVHKISSMDFPPGSEGAFLRDDTVNMFRNPLFFMQQLPSPLTQRMYDGLAAQLRQGLLNRPHHRPPQLTNAPAA